jgi:plastocyanin
MIRRRFLLQLAAFAGAAAAPPLRARAQTPVAGLPDGVSVAASGLLNPRGIAWDAGGVMHVAQAGLGGDTPSPGATPQEIANGLYYGGLTGSVVKIVDGCAVPVATGLPSTYGSGNGRHQGPAGLAFLDGVLYATNDGGGPPHGNVMSPNGVHAIDPQTGGWALVSDFNAWVEANPVAHVPGDYDPGGEPWNLITDGTDLLVIESNSGQIVRVAVNGETTRVIDLSDDHPVPTGLARDAEGNLYASTLSVTPYPDGAAKVMKIALDGTRSDHWTGLTATTALSLGPDGALYALEMATGNTTTPPFFSANSGRVVRQTGPDSLEVVAQGLDFPVAMSFGPDGALYVATPALRTPGTTGTILRIDLAAALPVDLAGVALPESRCTIAGLPKDAVDIQAEMLAGKVAPPDATPAAGGSAPAASGDAVSIANYAFSPASLSVASGTTVTWTNNDAVPHTATAKDGSFDSGNLPPGATFSHTFTAAGSIDYDCQYHAGMKGTIVVG